MLETSIGQSWSSYDRDTPRELRAVPGAPGWAAGPAPGGHLSSHVRGGAGQASPAPHSRTRPPGPALGASGMAFQKAPRPGSVCGWPGPSALYVCLRRTPQCGSHPLPARGSARGPVCACTVSAAWEGRFAPAFCGGPVTRTLGPEGGRLYLRRLAGPRTEFSVKPRPGWRRGARLP